jgi:hypothetical protein
VAKFTVLMNGEPFAPFATKEQAEAYVDMQKRKVRGAGVSAKIPEEKSLAFAARQKWSIRENAS